MSLTFWCCWREKSTPQPGNEPGTSQLSYECSYLLSYRGIHFSPFKQLATIQWPLCKCTKPSGSDWHLVVEHFVFKYKRVHLDCLGIIVENRCLWQSNVVEEKKSTPQPGIEPGTSQLSFECSTDWATRESIFLPSNNWPPSSGLYVIASNLQVVTDTLW